MLDSAQQSMRRVFDNVAEDFDTQDFFCAEIRERLSERLDLITLEPDNIVDLGTATGRAFDQLQLRFPDSRVIELDWSLNMLDCGTRSERDRVCADAHQLPFADASIDIIFSNLLLPGCADPEQIFSEARRVLRHPGLFLFSTLGPDTLKQIQRAWATVDDFAHVTKQADMHNVGDALVKAGFRDPVMDVEMLTINYRDVSKLITDLRAAGAVNRAANRNPGLTTPRQWKRFSANLGQQETGRFSVNFEVVCGQAWTGPDDTGVQMEDGVAHFPLSRLRQFRG